MNKYGFISGVFTFILLFFQYLPLGIYFERGDLVYIWIFKYLNLDSNPWFTSYAKIPTQIFHYDGKKIFLLGFVAGRNMQLWYQIHILSFIVLTIFPLIAFIETWIGCSLEKKNGKTLMKFNFYFLLTVMLYCVLGITIYSKEILNLNLSYYDFLFHLDYGFYILLIDLIFAVISVVKHPIK